MAIASIPLEIWLAGGLALYMAWAIGANDVANAMGTSVGSGALTVFAAIVVAGGLEFMGAFLAGGHVTDTVRKGMLQMDQLQGDQLVWGMLAALSAAATLLLAATRLGLPVSTTHSIVGGIVGFGLIAVGPQAVNWSEIGRIIASWVTSPLISGAIAFGVYQLTRVLILEAEHPTRRVRSIGPIFFFYVFFVIGLVTLFKGLKNLNLDLDFPAAVGLSVAIGLLGALIGSIFLRRVCVQPSLPGQRFGRVERVFVVLQVLTACAVAFAHGSNDVGNSIGPLAAVVGHVELGAITAKSAVAPWMLALGGAGIVLGLATWGYRVMETIGRRITELAPSGGFAAELAAVTTIALASRLGIPISTTHTLVGGVVGVGLARGIAALDIRVVRRVLLSWLATIPVAAGLAICFFYAFCNWLG